MTRTLLCTVVTGMTSILATSLSSVALAPTAGVSEPR
jgi:hypothetical protein